MLSTKKLKINTGSICHVACKGFSYLFFENLLSFCIQFYVYILYMIWIKYLIRKYLFFYWQFYLISLKIRILDSCVETSILVTLICERSFQRLEDQVLILVHPRIWYPAPCINCLFIGNVFLGLKQTVQKYWWAILIGVIVLVVLVILMVKICAVYTPSSNPQKRRHKPLPGRKKKNPRGSQGQELQPRAWWNTSYYLVFL